MTNNVVACLTDSKGMTDLAQSKHNNSKKCCGKPVVRWIPSLNAGYQAHVSKRSIEQFTKPLEVLGADRICESIPAWAPDTWAAARNRDAACDL